MVIKIESIPKKNTAVPCEFRSVVDEDIRYAVENDIFMFELVDDRYDYTKLATITMNAIRTYFLRRYRDDSLAKIKTAIPGISYHDETILSHLTFHGITDSFYKISKIYDFEQKRYRVYVTIKPNYEEIIWQHVNKELERNREHMEDEKRRKESMRYKR